MSDFEFLSVLISIVIGLGLTHLLAGLGRAFYARELNRLDPVHVAWTITVLFLLTLNWWVFLLWREVELWTFGKFFTIVVWTTTMYVLTLALYPPNLPADVNYREMFEQNRTWFLSTFTIMCVLDIVVSAQRDGGIPELFYLAYVSHYALITFLGIFIRRRWYDLAAAWYIAISMALWSLVVRQTLN